MHIIVKQKAFLQALSRGQSIVERQTTVPLLSHILLTAQEGSAQELNSEEDTGRLSLCVTDLDLSLVERINVAVKTPGMVALPVHTLFDIVRKLPSGAQIELSCEPHSSQAKLLSGKIDFDLACLPAGDFPRIEQKELPLRFQLPSGVLRTLIEKTRFAMSAQDGCYYSQGLHFHVQEGKVLHVVATDRNRLARSSIGVPPGAEKMPGMIIARKAVSALMRLLTDDVTDVVVSVSETKIDFVMNDVFFSSRLIDATFPDYQNAIPCHDQNHAQVPAEALFQAVDRISTMANTKDRVVFLSFFPEKLTLQATGCGHGSALEEIGIHCQGPPVQIMFNAEYLMDIAAQVAPQEEAHFFLPQPAISSTQAEEEGCNNAVLIHNGIDHHTFYVIMPVSH